MDLRLPTARYLLRVTGGHETNLLGGHACTTELAEVVGGQAPVSRLYGSVWATRKARCDDISGRGGGPG